jgi:integrase/recombinase XerD
MEEGLLFKLQRELEIINSSKKTVKAYTYYVKEYLTYSKNKGLNENSVKDYIHNQISKKGPSTVSSQISAIQFFFRKVLRQALNINHPKRNKTLPDILSMSDVKRLIENTPNLKHRLIIKLLYGTGLRVSEILPKRQALLNACILICCGIVLRRIYLSKGLIYG